MLVGLGLSLVSDTSDRPGHFSVISKIYDKNGPMELDADEPRKFQGPPDRILGQPTWVGGGRPGKILVGEGGGEKRRFSLEKRSERPWPLWGRGEFVGLKMWQVRSFNARRSFFNLHILWTNEYMYIYIYGSKQASLLDSNKVSVESWVLGPCSLHGRDSLLQVLQVAPNPQAGPLSHRGAYSV